MKDIDTVIKNGNVVIPKTGVKKINIAVKKGKIVGLFDPNISIKAKNVIDVNNNYILPGVIEPHSHIELADEVNKYYTETKSAAVGGVTTILTYLIDNKNYCNLFKKFKTDSSKQAVIDYSAHFCLTATNQINYIPKYINDYGISSFKLFMNFKGDEGKYMGVSSLDDGFLYQVFSELGKYSNVSACIHAENIEIIWMLRNKLLKQGTNDLLSWEKSRPDFVETEAIRRAMYLGKITNCPIYIAHLSTEKGYNEIVKYRNSEYKNVFIETCPHYLKFTSHSKLDTLGKVNPPLRYKKDLEALWQGIKEGEIDTIGSDHVPRKKEKKLGTIWEASSGYPGVATLLPVLLSEGVNKRNINIEKIAEVTSYNIAKIFNIYPRKGTIQIGSDADFTIIDLDLEKEVKWNNLESSSDYTIYEGQKLKGWPILSMVRGKVVMKEGQVIGEKGYGEYIKRTPIKK